MVVKGCYGYGCLTSLRRKMLMFSAGWKQFKENLQKKRRKINLN
jgi:hypothetical protein